MRNLWIKKFEGFLESQQVSDFSYENMNDKNSSVDKFVVVGQS